ncbi:NtaA/DmoA family FMN-dependent monooxygenase [Microvirga brassicacearum]|nr:NtaA/DmoA family FMN-dependent monooxygenase [Microvirga brassicacearum]
MNMPRHMMLAGYILVPGSHFGGMWRHPYSETDFCDRAVYENVARTLERGCFDVAFVPESLSVPTGPKGDHDALLKYGAVGAVRHDPSHLVAPMIAATRHLGFTITLSTTYMEPYHLARIFGTLDHFSEGRIAWNVVTSAGESNAYNFGHHPVLDHAQLYDRADEVVDVCTRLWTSWDKDAIVRDQASGLYAHPDKIHRLDHEGAYFKVRGPLSLPRGPGAGPVLMVAGVSPRGRDFAARWADVVFAIQSDADGMRELRRDIRARAARFGRADTPIKLLAAVQPIIGETTEIAQARAAYLDRLIHPEMARAFFSAMLGMDLASYDLATPIEEVLRAEDGRTAVDAGAARPWLQRVVDERPDHTWTLGEVAAKLSQSSSTPRLIGTASEIADQLEQLFVSEACDGFVVTPTHFPGSFEEFTRAVVPELQRRGLMRTKYRHDGFRSEIGVDTRSA